jgi:hypothetical protein
MTFRISFKFIRLTHRYLGLFFAPAILFFAITGSLQMFGLHEPGHGRPYYVPPSILVHLAQLHKNATLYVPPRRVTPPSPVKPAGTKLDAPKPVTPIPISPSPPLNRLPMKIFFAATALALAISTCTGIVMGWKHARRKWIVLLTLAAGVVLPAILLCFEM